MAWLWPVHRTSTSISVAAVDLTRLPARLCYHSLERCVFGPPLISETRYDVQYVGPKENSIGQITEFQSLFLSAGFLSYTSVCIASSVVIVLYFGPKYAF